MGTRRDIVQQLGALCVALQAAPARSTPAALQVAIRAFAGSAVPREGRVTLDIAPLVENGNAVPVTVSVEGSTRVLRIGLFTERNPLPEVALFEFGPRSGRAAVATRMRLATSQRIVALALLADGSCWMAQADVVVTLAACVEG